MESPKVRDGQPSEASINQKISAPGRVEMIIFEKEK